MNNLSIAHIAILAFSLPTLCGAQQFTEESALRFPLPALLEYTNQLTAGDIDNDGDLDLVIARLGSGGERVYNNDGSGNFTQVANILPVISDSSLDILVADLTGNGKLDVVTAQGESGSFINRIYINGGPADTQAPRFFGTEQLKDVLPKAPLVVRASIVDDMSSDRNFFDRGVILNFSVNGGASQQVVMKYSGGTIYRGSIPAQSAGSMIEYFVAATDFAGNTGSGNVVSVMVGGIIMGDVNCDGVLNLLDVTPFVNLLVRNEFSNKADFNGDGAVTLLDVAPFIAALTG